MVAKIKKKTKAKAKKTAKTTTKKRKATRSIVSKKVKTAKIKKKVSKIPKKTKAVKTSSSSPSSIKPYEISGTEDYMNDKQSNHFKTILGNWKLSLMKEVDHTITEMKEASVLADPNDRATQEEAFNLELRTRDRERKLIKKIEEALQQIEEKNYGYCETCGVEIGIRRLEARPTATLCIDCKTLAEIREKRA